MKTPNKTQQIPERSRPVSILASLTLMTTVVSLLAGLTPAARAANVLQNPGFEVGSGVVDWTAREDQSWPMGPASGQGKLYHAGANAFWMQGEYGNPSPNLIYEYQTIACAAGSTFTANAFFSQYVSHDSTVSEGGDPAGVGSGLFTSDSGGQEDGWLEVAFLDKNNKILSDYRSVIIDPAYETALISGGATTTSGAQVYLTWLNCQVTNQYDVSQIPTGSIDPDTYAAAITNTLGAGQYMVAPVGTANVQFRLSLFQAADESGASYWDDCSLNLVGGPAPSVIGNVSPDGSHYFNTVPNGFTFTITSASSGGATLPDNPTNGVKVVVNGTDQSSSLQFSGNTKNWNVTLPTVTSNMVYNIAITVSNTAGLLATHTATFDTFNTNAFVVYTEDYDFGGGQFIQNPIPTNGTSANSYWGTAGTLGIDQNFTGGGTTLAPAYPDRTDSNVDFQVSTDLQMPLYAAQSNSAIYNVNISYNNGGNWLNYTRNPYPQGASVVFARISGGQGRGVEYLNILTGGYGTATQATNRLGQFVLANGTDWGSYSWLPLTDSLGNFQVINIPSGRQTLQLLSGGGVNVIDFLIVPAGSVALPPIIANLMPPLDTQNTYLLGTNSISFTVSTIQSTLPTTNIVVTINGVAVTPSFTGKSTNWTVTVPIPQNQMSTMVISATDANGLNKTVTYSFDTFDPNNFVFEAEDYDFAGGHFIDNPAPTGNTDPGLATTEPNSYYFYPAGDGGNSAIADVDFNDVTLNAGETHTYRPEDLSGTDVAQDSLRQKFIVNGGAQTNSDYYIGWWNAGTWYNYTRTYPSGNFKVYGRLAGGAAYTGVTLSQVTAGQGTTTQTTQPLGTFSDATANGWQNWHWVPMLDGTGQPAVITLGGVETLRATAGSGANANYYMLVPVVTPLKLSAAISQGKIMIQFPTQTGTNYTVLSKNSLTGGTWQQVGTSIPGTGATITVTNTMPQGQTQQYYKVLGQ